MKYYKVSAILNSRRKFNRKLTFEGICNQVPPARRRSHLDTPALHVCVCVISQYRREVSMCVFVCLCAYRRSAINTHTHIHTLSLTHTHTHTHTKYL